MLRERLKDNIEMVEHTLADGTTKLVKHLNHTHSPVHDVNTEGQTRLHPCSIGLPLAVAVRLGSLGFFLLIVGWMFS